MGYTPGGGEANGKGKRNGWAMQKARWAGDFGGSGEGMYYRVFEPVACSARLKPPPPHGKPRLYRIKAGFKGGCIGGAWHGRVDGMTAI